MKKERLIKIENVVVLPKIRRKSKIGGIKNNPRNGQARGRMKRIGRIITIGTKIKDMIRNYQRKEVSTHSSPLRK